MPGPITRFVWAFSSFAVAFWLVLEFSYHSVLRIDGDSTLNCLDDHVQSLCGPYPATWVSAFAPPLLAGLAVAVIALWLTRPISHSSETRGAA